jgi:hypothetical protein
MSDDHGDAFWEAFVLAMLAAGPAAERRSRYGDKPALFSAGREIAHLEVPGVIDVRITRAGWSQVKDRPLGARMLEDRSDDPEEPLPSNATRSIPPRGKA